MARKQAKKDRSQSILDSNRAHIAEAQRSLYKSVLGPVLEHAYLLETGPHEGKAFIAELDPDHGAIWVNPHNAAGLKSNHWTFVIGHHLLHLALGHGRSVADRRPDLWNLACDHAADNFLHSFKVGVPPPGFAVEMQFAGMREDDIYELLLNDKSASGQYLTFAGANRPDMARRQETTERISRYVRRDRRTDWEALFAEGIRRAVDEAVRQAGDALGQSDDGSRQTWRPGEVARKWVMNEFPLLGAVAAHMTIVANNDICDRMDISVAAIDSYLGEIYFRPAVGLTTEEVIFVYVHELLHAALLHHSRLKGRDPWLWNIACDFVINGWLIEMGVGRFPSVGGLYDPILKGMSADEVYDLLMLQPGRCKKARGFRGALGDILFDSPGRRIYRGDAGTIDDIYRRAMSAGMSSMGRGFVPGGLLEEIQSLFTPAVPWDVELAQWMDANVPMIRDPRRTYARASRRQASTPDIPRPARFVPQEWREACTFGVVMDTSGSMDRELLGRALGAIASYSEARDVPQVRVILCDAQPYDQGYLAPTDLRGTYAIKGRGGTVLQPAVSLMERLPDFPVSAPIMIITDGWCEEELIVSRQHCFVLPRKGWKEGAMTLRTSAPVFRVLKEEAFDA